MTIMLCHSNIKQALLVIQKTMEEKMGSLEMTLINCRVELSWSCGLKIVYLLLILMLITT